MYPQPSAPVYYPGQPFPGQPYPYQPYPGQGYPAQPYPGMSPLPPHLSAFNTHYDADQTWEGTPSDVPKELGLLDNRKNDMYPQGRDNCIQFLRECQMKGLSFKIKAKKTRPYWTWYYELNSSSTPVVPGGFAPGLSPHLSAFTTHYDADQTWEGTPADVPKELGLLDNRKNDMYPQGRDNCIQFLRECQMKGLSFKIKAKKTRPYWTWYYEVNNSGCLPTPSFPTPSFFPGLSPHLSAFTMHHDADQTWEGTPADVPKELGLLDNRKNDMYPQGRDNCIQFLRECQTKGLRFKIKAKKTKPYWTWYYEV